MGYIKFEAKHLDDDVWLNLSPAAFVVHTWALSWCNEQATDGRISKNRAARLNCPVTPGQLSKAWRELTASSLWIDEGDAYVCPMFLSHGIAADEQTKTRGKWSEDKRRQRLHNIGNHDLCTERSCRAVKRPPVESTQESTSGQVDDQTRPDQTRPDPTLRGGEGRGGGRRSPSAGAPGEAAAAGGRHHWSPDCCELTAHPENRHHHQPGECQGCDDPNHTRLRGLTA